MTGIEMALKILFFTGCFLCWTWGLGYILTAHWDMREEEARKSREELINGIKEDLRKEMGKP